MEPKLTTEPGLAAVKDELMKREPVFHHPEYGTRREDLENMTDAAFWEVGASGRRYSREYVLDVVEERFKNPVEEDLRMQEFHCLEIVPDNYLVTYTLFQGERVTRRSTLWRRSGEGWKVVYHQGTVVQDR